MLPYPNYHHTIQSQASDKILRQLPACGWNSYDNIAKLDQFVKGKEVSQNWKLFQKYTISRSIDSP